MNYMFQCMKREHRDERYTSNRSPAGDIARFRQCIRNPNVTVCGEN
jgi:hypothetical protein